MISLRKKQFPFFCISKKMITFAADTLKSKH